MSTEKLNGKTQAQNPVESSDLLALIKLMTQSFGYECVLSDGGNSFAPTKWWVGAGPTGTGFPTRNRPELSSSPPPRERPTETPLMRSRYLWIA